MKKSLKAVFVALLMIGAVGFYPAMAQAGGQEHTHDGLFLRLAGGIGFAAASTDIEINLGGTSYDATYTLYGGSGIFDFGIGYSLGRNLALYWSIIAWVAAAAVAVCAASYVAAASMRALGTSQSSSFPPPTLVTFVLSPSATWR